MDKLSEILLYVFLGMAGWLAFGLAWTFLYRFYLKITAERLEVAHKRKMLHIHNDLEDMLREAKEMGAKLEEHADSIEEDGDKKVVH